MAQVEWEHVDSSNVNSVAYHEPTQTLGVRFANGQVYGYSGVEPDKFHGLVGSSSVGKYLANVIKGSYPYTNYGSEEDFSNSLDDD